MITEEKGFTTKRNSILKIAVKHGRGTVKEHLNGLRSAISRAARKRNSKPCNRSEDQFSDTGRGNFNSRSFFRGFSQISGGSVTNGNDRQEVQKCFYCDQPGHFASRRSCPLRGNPHSYSHHPKESRYGKGTVTYQ